MTDNTRWLGVGSNGESLPSQPVCPRCGSTDGALGTQNGYFMCGDCRQAGRLSEVYWTDNHEHPGDWTVAIRLSPHGHDGKHGASCPRCATELVVIKPFSDGDVE